MMTENSAELCFVDDDIFAPTGNSGGPTASGAAQPVAGSKNPLLDDTDDIFA